MEMLRENRLRCGIRFALFATSYSPLFVLIILRQISNHYVFLNWGGISKESLKLFFLHFSIIIVLVTIILIGLLGIYVFIFRISRSTQTNGTNIQVTEVKNRNSESINYIATYIIPFLFQDFSLGFDLLSLVILLVVIYFIYINSTLLLINPLLNLLYSLYEVEFLDNSKPQKGLIITKEKYLEENDQMVFKKIGHKLYFGIMREY